MSRVSIGENCVISEKAELLGNVVIGDNTFIDDYVKIGYPRIDPDDLVECRSSDYSQFVEEFSDRYLALTEIGSGSIVRSSSIIYSGCRIGSHFDCGHNVIIRENCEIAENVYLKINTEIKSDVQIGAGSVVAGIVADRTVIEDDVTTHGLLLHTYASGRRFEIEPAPIIRKGAFIGRGAIVVGGIEIGEYARVGAGAMVSEDLAAYARTINVNSSVRNK